MEFDKMPGGLDEVNMHFVFPTIKSVNRNGREMFWRIKVSAMTLDGTPLEINPEWLLNMPIPEPIIAVITVDSGIVGGKIKDASPTYVRTGKNIGRSNETNIFCQALRDALGKYNKQLRGATHEGNVDIMLPPMLASVFDPASLNENKDGDVLFVQRKYNGVRAVVTLAPGNKVFMYSRGNKEYGAWPELFGEVEPILREMPGYYIDGEIFAEGLALQDISGKVRKGDYSGLTFYAYDLFVAPTLNGAEDRFEDRLGILEENFGGLTRLKIVETFDVDSLSEVKPLYDRFIAEGYEGAMIRKNEKYIFSYNKYRSNVLLKYKPSFDAEYKIIGFTQGQKGKALGALMLICETEQGIRFDVTPAETIPVRKKLYSAFIADPETFNKKWNGKMLIVEYDELSVDDVPQRARTRLLVRDLEKDEVVKMDS